MATRNRTDEFLQLRGFKRSKRGDTDRLLTEEGARAVTVTPNWVHKMEDVRAVEKQISAQLQELDHQHKEHLKVQFGVSRDDDREQREIERITVALSRKFKEAEEAVGDLDVTFKEELTEGGTEAELSILHNVKMCLVNEVTKLSRVFRDAQRHYMKELQKQKNIRERWSGGTRQKEIQERMERDAMMDSYIQRGFTQDQIETIILNQHTVEDRDREFQEIYASIKTIHEMFKDLHTLIMEQGTVLDRIDYNMTMAHDKVVKARKELQAAAKHQEAGRFKLCVMFLVVMIIGFLIALMFKLG